MKTIQRLTSAEALTNLKPYSDNNRNATSYLFLDIEDDYKLKGIFFNDAIAGEKEIITLTVGSGSTGVSSKVNYNGVDIPFKNASFLPLIFDNIEFDNGGMFDDTISVDSIALGVQSGTTLQDTTKAWNVDEWKDYVVQIIGGTGVGQVRIISSTTVDTLTVSSSWGTNPDGTSTYQISKKSRLTIPDSYTGGPFTVFTRCTFDASALGIRGVALYVNNVFSQSVFMNPITGAESSVFLPATPIELNAGDYIELHAYQSCGLVLNTLPIGDRIYLSLQNHQ